MTNIRLKLVIPLLLLSFFLFFIPNTYAATGDEDIYNVSSTVKNNWNKISGSKETPATSGRRIVSDVYMNKYVDNGYEVVNKDFGKGKQPYIHFSGWSVLMGYKEHTSTNQDTYIAAMKTAGTSELGSVKIYKTIQWAADATEDLEYNNQGAGIWNECPAGATNRAVDDCNMRYADVNYQAYLPLDELFGNDEDSKYFLYLIKKVDNQIVVTPLILPFDFTDKAYNGGKLSLSSGQETNTLRMNTDGVLRRSTPRESAPSVIDALGDDRYFEEATTYKKVDYEESQTAIWYGVTSPVDGNKKKWAQTSYWTFQGSQAVLDYQANRPPVAKFSFNPSNTVYNDTSVGLINDSSDPDNDPLTYKWERKPYGTDDSNYEVFSTDKTPKTFKMPKGRYTFQLTVSDGKFESSVRHYLYVNNRPPEAKFSFNPSNTVYNDTSIGIVNTSSDIDGDSLTYKWERKPYGSDDSNYEVFSTDKTPENFTMKKGNYTFQLTVSDGEEEASVRRYLYVINRPPVAKFSFDPSNTVYNDTSIGIINTSIDVDGDSLTYKWERKPYGSNDSNYQVFSTEQNPKRFTLDKGNYTFQLTVSDGEEEVSVRHYLYVINRPPVADFSWNPTTIYNNTEVAFINKSNDLDKDTLSYTWEYQKSGSNSWNTFSQEKDPRKLFDERGDWNIRLTTNDGEASSTVTKTLTVDNRPPVAKFNYSPDTIYNDTKVLFQNLSTDEDGDTLTYKWEVQEPNSTNWTEFSTSKDPNHVLNKKGSWKVRLTVTDVTGASDNVTKTITVGNRPPTASFTYSPITIYNDSTVKFTNTSTDKDGDTLTYKWEYQKPNSTTWTSFSTEKDPSSLLNQKGDWKVRLTVTDVNAASDSVTQTIKVTNRPPVANFTYSPQTIYNDTTVLFKNSSTDDDGDALTYKWEVQKPNTSTWTQISTDKDTSEVLELKGDWKVRLTVIDDSNASDSITKTVTVGNRPPKADFTYNPKTVYNDTNITFTNTSKDDDGDTLTYKWEVQKPNETSWHEVSTEKDITKILNLKGNWKVKLTVTDSSKASDTISKIIEVKNRPPVADFMFSPSTIYNNTTVTFTNQSSDLDKDPLTYQWEYQAPNSSSWTSFSTALNPSKVFNTIGEWKIRLTVKDDSGETDSKTKSLEVKNRAPEVTLTYNPDDVYEGDTVNICVNVNDPDGQKMNVKLYINKDNTTKSLVLNKEGVTSGSTLCYEQETDTGRYDISVEVNDGYDTTEVETWFNSKPLILKGHVNHTEDWLNKHNESGHSLDKFYSGEKFLLQADVSSYPVEYVKTTLIAEQTDNTPIKITKTLSKLSDIIYDGFIYDERHQKYPTNLKKGPAQFEFEVKYTNGVIKRDTVNIEIIDDVFNVYKYHRVY
ncbi:PKD domain-containing protein [Niallia taxi]|nr:PKD domain-containing protein [Niallia taxi]MDE5055295.1 PKD domain-containing protein [Niallia taxi]